jgi:hypothetical protein
MTPMSGTSVGALVALLLALLACNEDSALDYAQLSIHATDLIGTPAPGDAASACVVLPVLRGSRVDERFRVAAQLEVTVTADRNEAVVSFPHASPEVETLHVSKDDLEQPDFLQNVQVFDETGQEWLVQLGNDCDSDAAGN